MSGINEPTIPEQVFQLKPSISRAACEQVQIGVQPRPRRVYHGRETWKPMTGGA
jgi:hypothetical protein